MASSKPKTVRKPPADSTAAVDELMSSLEHPHKGAIEAIRQAIRGADPRIAEGVKWNAPSFRTTEYFATTHLRTKNGVGVIFHFGAKAREIGAVAVEDPEGMLTWLAKDRAMVTFAGLADVQARAPALQAIVRQWITQMAINARGPAATPATEPRG